MPAKPKPKKPVLPDVQDPPDVSSVRSLIKSVRPLARYVGKTPNAIYRWIELNRIPAAHIIKVARFYDIDLPLHLAQSEAKDSVPLKEKPRDTLPVCLEVQAGNLTIEEAAERLGIHVRAVQLILANWREQLPLLYKTLLQLESREISLDQAADTLQITKFTIHALRKKYGFRPTPKPTPPDRPIVKRRQEIKKIALDAIAGRIKLNEIEESNDLSWRTIHRVIKKLSPEYQMIHLVHWPKALRQAYAQEIEENRPNTSVKLWKYAEITGIQLKKYPKYPAPPKDWRHANTRQMMIHTLLGDETVESIAEKRGADPSILEALFTSDLRPLDLTWPELRGAPVMTQTAVAELLLTLEESKKPLRQRTIERMAEEKQ